MTVCQPTVMMFALFSRHDDTSTIGPGSRWRRIWLTGKSLLLGCLAVDDLLRDND